MVWKKHTGINIPPIWANFQLIIADEEVVDFPIKKAPNPHKDTTKLKRAQMRWSFVFPCKKRNNANIAQVIPNDNPAIANRFTISFPCLKFFWMCLGPNMQPHLPLELKLPNVLLNIDFQYLFSVSNL